MRLWTTLAFSALAAACGSGDSPLAPSAPADTAPLAGSAAATAAAHAHDVPTATPLAEGEPAVPVIEQQVAYGEADSRNLVGYLAVPRDAVEPLPGLLVIHEWWGLNDNVKAMTRRLAGEGYVALAVDLYGGEVAADPQSAAQLMRGVTGTPDAVRANLQQAYEYLETYAFAPKVGTIGWCLGGGWALQAALHLPEKIDAVVMYYGEVDVDRSRLAVLDAPLLGLFAERDTVVPATAVRAFEQLLGDLGKNADVRLYPNVEHAFANPSGGSYDAGAATDAWEATRTFLRSNLR